jgi:hypothetical protein
MDNTTLTYVIGAISGAVVFGLLVGFVLVPAWSAYSRLWERLAASFLSIYVAAAAVGFGVALGTLVIWLWDRYGIG